MGSEWWTEFRGRGVRAALRAATRYAENEAAIDALLAGGGGLAHQATILTAHADIITLRTIYQEIIPTPGANRMLLPIAGVIVPTIVAPYASVDAFSPTGGVGLLLVAYGDWIEEGLGYVNASQLLEGSRVMYMPQWLDEESWNSDATVSASATSPNIVNLPIKLIAGNTGDFSAGNAGNSLRTTVEFRVLDTVTGVFLSTSESGWDESTRTFT